MHKDMGGDTAGTGGPNLSKGYSITYEVMLSHKTRGKVGGEATAQGLAGYRPVGGEQLFSSASLSWVLFLYLAFLFVTILLLLLLLFSFISVINLFLSHGFSHSYPSNSLPPPCWGGSE